MTEDVFDEVPVNGFSNAPKVHVFNRLEASALNTVAAVECCHASQVLLVTKANSVTDRQLYPFVIAIEPVSARRFVGTLDCSSYTPKFSFPAADVTFSANLS